MEYKVEDQGKLINTRIEKINEIREMGINPFPYNYDVNNFSQEIKRIKSELRNIEYRINFFGVTDKLLEDKKEIMILKNWMKQEIDEISQTLLKYN